MEYATFLSDLTRMVAATGITQDKLSELSGVKQTSISSILLGKNIPRADRMLALWPFVYGAPLARPEITTPPPSPQAGEDASTESAEGA